MKVIVDFSGLYALFPPPKDNSAYPLITKESTLKTLTESLGKVFSLTLEVSAELVEEDEAVEGCLILELEPLEPLEE